MQNIVTAIYSFFLPPSSLFWKYERHIFFFRKSRFSKRRIKRRSMKVARKVAVAFCVSSLLSSCSALQEILQSSLRIPHHFIKTWLEVRGGGWGRGRDYWLIHMWFEVFFFDNHSKVFKKERATLRTLCDRVDIVQCRWKEWKLGVKWQCRLSVFLIAGGAVTSIVYSFR